MKMPKPYKYRWQRWMNHTDEGQIAFWLLMGLCAVMAVQIFLIEIPYIIIEAIERGQ